MFSTMGSRIIYRGRSSEELEISPLISPSRESEDELRKVSLISTVSLIRQWILWLPPTPLPISPPSPPSPPTPPLPPPQFSMASAIKLPIFKGVGNEDLDQFWFMVREIGEAKGVIDDNINRATLVSALYNCALTWYLKHSNDHPNAWIDPECVE